MAPLVPPGSATHKMRILINAEHFSDIDIKVAITVDLFENKGEITKFKVTIISFLDTCIENTVPKNYYTFHVESFFSFIFS